MSPETTEELRKLAAMIQQQNEVMTRLAFEASAQIEDLKAKVAALEGKMK